MRHLPDRERHGTVEDVSLDELAVLRTFDRKDVTPSGIHHHHLGIGLLVKTAELHTELVVVRIEVGA